MTERIVWTEYPGHASEIVRESARYSGYAVVGGDGTLFEVIRGIGRVELCGLALSLEVRIVPRVLQCLAAVNPGCELQ